MELLVVIAIVSIVAAISASTMTGDANSDQKKALVAVSNVLETARQAAVANNTYVYVGFTTPVSPGNRSDPLCVAVFQSLSGLDVLRAAMTGGQALLAENQSPGSPGSWRTITRPQWLRNATLESTKVAPDSILPEEEKIGTGFATTITKLSNGAGFSLTRKIGEMPTAAALKFDRIVTFSPSGTAFVDNTLGLPVSSIGVLLKPCRGPAPSSKEEAQTAAILVNGLLGSTRIYQLGSAQ